MGAPVRVKINGQWQTLGVAGSVIAPAVVGAGQALVRRADGSWVPEYVATQQDLDDLRDEFEEHHHDARYRPGWLAGVFKITGDRTVGATAFNNGDRFPYDSSNTFAFDGGSYLTHTFLHRGFGNTGWVFAVYAGGTVTGSGDSLRHTGGTLLGTIGNEGIAIAGGAVAMSSSGLVSGLIGVQNIHFCAEAWGGATKSPTAYASGNGLATIEIWRA